MLSSKFVQLIEGHCDQIARSVLRRLQSDPRTPHIAGLPETETLDQCQDILRNLGHWLVASNEEEVARRFEAEGRTRAGERVPLQESVHALNVLKERMLDYVRDQGLALTSVDLYAEEELEHQVGCFFDSVVYYVVKGYEEKREESARAAITA